MKNFEWARERIRAGLKHQYGVYLNEVKDAVRLDTVAEGLVIDATLDAERKFRVTVYLNTRELDEDEPSKLCMDAYAQLEDNPDRIIIVVDFLDDESESWLEDTDLEVDKMEGFWVIRSQGNNEKSLDYVMGEIFDILNGKQWKIGCRQGRGNNLNLLAVEQKCPRCGKTVWVPDHLLLSVIPTDNQVEKPWIISLASIHRYSVETIRQIAATFNAISPAIGRMTVEDSGAFTVHCSGCGEKVADLKESDRDWFQHEMGDLWYRWIDLNVIPDDVKMIPMQDVRLNYEDVDNINSSIDCMEGVVFMGEYSISELFSKSFASKRWDEWMSDIHVIQRHLLSSPMFKAKIPGTLAEIETNMYHEMLYGYAHTAIQAINKLCNVE